jgi:tetratricopeptide (TPR) repeat protein
MREDNAYSLLQRGRELLAGDDPAQAVLVLEQARRAQPGKGSILETLGRAYYSWGRYRKSAASFEEALGVDPTNDYAHYCLGLCYLKLERTPEAAGHFKIAWSLKPRDIYQEKAVRFGAADTGGQPGAGAT